MSSIEDEIEAQFLHSPLINSYQPPFIPGISNDDSLEEDPSAAFLENNEGDQVPNSIRFQRGIPNRVPRIVGLVREFALHAPRINTCKEQGIISGWKDVNDLDSFLSSLYNYYTGKGYYCILSNQLTTLLIILFIVVFSIFLFYCIDYDLLRHPTSKHLFKDVLYDSCGGQLPWFMKIIFFFFCVWWLWNLFRFSVNVAKLRQIKEFYENVLNINDQDMNNLRWADVSAKITSTYKQQSHAHSLDAHMIANRIMRQENYLIALFNKDILDLSIPFIFGRQQLLTKLLEWALSYCILSFVFKENGQIDKRFLKEKNSTALTLG